MQHLISDPHRGFLLEVLVTKAMYTLSDSVQIVGMSATLPNVADLAHWIHGSLYCTTFRPVDLDMIVCFVKHLHRPKSFDNPCPGSFQVESQHMFFEPVRSVEKLQLPRDIDSEGFISLCIESMKSGRNVLLFCPSKERCERCCDLLIEAIRFINCGIAITERMKAGRSNALIELQQTPVGICPRLLKSIPHGVAYHHAGLIADERKIIEKVIYLFFISPIIRQKIVI